VGQFIVRDARPGIGHFDHYIGAVFESAHFDRVAIFGEFESIVEQVVQSQQDQVFVAGDLRQRPGGVGNGEGQVAVVCLGVILGQGKRFLQDTVEVDRRAIDRTGFQLSQLAQVGSQAAEAQRLGFDAEQGFLAGFGGRGLGNVRQAGANGGKRVFKLVIQAL
jgi:pyruvate/2-oxoglutarate dehydrogenase complex dihydrolipoamide dehydrogenase (E3) component